MTVKLAKDFGFCWGVERAVAMAYEARSHYADDTIHITNEIIHNPGVNNRIGEMGINFVPVKEDGVKDFSKINTGDVVILPAFGASLEEMQLLDERKVKIVDTTCPWVSKGALPVCPVPFARRDGLLRPLPRTVSVPDCG